MGQEKGDGVRRVVDGGSEVWYSLSCGQQTKLSGER